MRVTCNSSLAYEHKVEGRGQRVSIERWVNAMGNYCKQGLDHSSHVCRKKKRLILENGVDATIYTFYGSFEKHLIAMTKL
jgi:hypothetical protein